MPRIATRASQMWNRYLVTPAPTAPPTPPPTAPPTPPPTAPPTPPPTAPPTTAPPTPPPTAPPTPPPTAPPTPPPTAPPTPPPTAPPTTAPPTPPPTAPPTPPPTAPPTPPPTAPPTAAPPEITSYYADYYELCQFDGTDIYYTFSGGTGSINHIGAVTSGGSSFVSSAGLIGRTYTLTVTGAGGTVTSAITINWVSC